MINLKIKAKKKLTFNCGLIFVLKWLVLAVRTFEDILSKKEPATLANI